MARRTTAQREKDLERIAEMYLHGWRQSDIAHQLSVTQQSVSNDLKELYRRWQQSALLDIDAAKARELARIDELERTYWIEYEASQKDTESETSKAIQNVKTIRKDDKDETVGTPTRAEKTIRKEQRLGDPQYLRGVQWCIERRCAIVGIDAPKRQEIAGKDGGAIPIVITKMDVNEL